MVVVVEEVVAEGINFGGKEWSYQYTQKDIYKFEICSSRRLKVVGECNPRARMAMGIRKAECRRSGVRKTGKR